MSCSKSPFSAPGEVDNIFVWALILTNTMTLSSPSVPSRMHKGLRVVLASGFGGRNWFFSKTIGFFAIYAVKCETAYRPQRQNSFGILKRGQSKDPITVITANSTPTFLNVLLWPHFDPFLTSFWSRNRVIVEHMGLALKMDLTPPHRTVLTSLKESNRKILPLLL